MFYNISFKKIKVGNDHFSVLDHYSGILRSVPYTIVYIYIYIYIYIHTIV